MRVLVTTLILLSTVTLLGCSTKVRTERVLLLPPKSLLVKCVPAPTRELKFNRDLVNDRNAWRSAYLICATYQESTVDWLIKACMSEADICEYSLEPSTFGTTSE